MREILFRGYTRYGAWVYGSLIKIGDYCCILQEDDGKSFDYPYLDPELGTIDGYATPVLPETVGQWTGLTDWHGEKIFEGDIISISIEDPVNEDKKIVVGYYPQDFEPNEYEIIGNFWENPELL